jgi:hypothetical protein
MEISLNELRATAISLIEEHDHLSDDDFSMILDALIHREQLSRLGYTGKTFPDGSFDIPNAFQVLPEIL